MSDLLKKWSSLWIKEPQRTFRELGITDDRDLLTNEGQHIFLSWLLKKNESEFAKDVEKLKEEKCN